MNRSHFIKLLGIGAATPLLLKAGVSLEKEYVPLGIMKCMVNEPFLFPPGTHCGNWLPWHTVLNRVAGPGHGASIQYADDLKQELKILVMDESGKHPKRENGNLCHYTMQYPPGTFRYVYSPSSHIDPRYADYLKPGWKPVGEMWKGQKQMTMEELMRKLKTADHRLATSSTQLARALEVC